MSNQATIQQETTIIHRTQKMTKTVSVFDDYAEGSICLDEYCDTFYEDDLELLLFVLEAIRTGASEAIDSILNSVFGNEKGMFIEDTWYNWEQLKPVFEKAGY